MTRRSPGVGFYRRWPFWSPPLLAAATVLALLGGACGQRGASSGLTGNVQVDGSSTVFPISEAVAEEFGLVESKVRVTAGISGTGGGFERFCAGETDINDASRPIKDSERESCAAAGIDWLELRVAFDGLSVAVHKDNDFAACLTTDELKRMWEPGSRVNRWRDVRADFPDSALHLYGPDTDSGTFDYFTDAIVGEEDASRADYTASADDNVLVQGIAGDKGALGYFGFAYYAENSDKLKLVAVDDGSGCVAPSPETIRDGTYAPLSRPLLIYVKRQALQRPEVSAFLRFYLENAAFLAQDVGYVPLPDAEYEAGLAMLSEGALQTATP